MDESQEHRGWDIWMEDRRIAMHLIHSWPEKALKVVAEAQLPADAWTLVSVTYNGSGKAEGVAVSYDGKPQKPRIDKNQLHEESIKTSAALTVGSRSKGGDLKGVGLADLSIWGRTLSAEELAACWRAHRLQPPGLAAGAESPSSENGNVGSEAAACKTLASLAHGRVAEQARLADFAAVFMRRTGQRGTPAWRVLPHDRQLHLGGCGARVRQALGHQLGRFQVVYRHTCERTSLHVLRERQHSGDG
jgi:hypothetical protein